MRHTIKWLLAVLVLVGTSAIVNAALEHNLYVPMVLNQPTTTSTVTPTSTTTNTPTGTITIFPTPTQTRTPTPSHVYILEIQHSPIDDPLNEYVSIKNASGKEVVMTGWRLRDESQNIYYFPTFTLKHGYTVKVWTKAGTNDSANLYWGSDHEIWNNHGDCAYLRNEKNDKVDSKCY